jgi:hypothetical protein
MFYEAETCSTQHLSLDMPPLERPVIPLDYYSTDVTLLSTLTCTLSPLLSSLLLSLSAKTIMGTQIIGARNQINNSRVLKIACMFGILTF